MGIDTSDSMAGMAGHTGQVRIAYSLNNTQPVICTLVSNQPLFFMDYEESFEEDAALTRDPFDIENIERGIRALEEKIVTLDRMAAEEHGIPEKRKEDFLADAAFIGEPYVEIEDSFEFERAALLKSLQQSRFAAAMLEHVRHYGTDIRMNSQGGSAHYDRRDGQIYISPHLDRAEQVLLALRELRRAWQHRNGALLHPLTFHPDQAILVNRALSADLAVTMVRTAWELQLSGDREPWERLEFSPMGDLATAFAREAFLDFRTLNNGVASSAVFEAWFLSERCRHQDRLLIQQMLSDYQGYVFEPGQIAQRVTAEFIVALGSLPFGKNYLAPYINTIINDALFTEVRDRSNANFLWFIKFERSFRETEQALQHNMSDTGAGDRRALHNDKNKQTDGHGKTADIVTLPGNGSVRNHRKAGDAGAGKVIAFHGASKDA